MSGAQEDEAGVLQPAEDPPTLQPESNPDEIPQAHPTAEDDAGSAAEVNSNTSDIDNDRCATPVEIDAIRHQPMYFYRPQLQAEATRSCHVVRLSKINDHQESKGEETSSAMGQEGETVLTCETKEMIYGLFEATVDVELVRGLTGWVELLELFTLLKIPEAEVIKQKITKGSYMDRLYIKLLVLVQDRLLFIREDFSTEPPVEERSKFTDNIPPVQLRAIDRLFLQLEEVEKTASWQALRQISLDYPSPKHIVPKYNPQALYPLHRLLFHLLFPLEPSHLQYSLDVLDLRSMGPAASSGCCSSNSDDSWGMEQFEWSEWLRWLLHVEDGEEVLRLVEAARGAGRSLEAELLARVGKKFGHICMMDSVIELIPQEVFTLVDGLTCICEPRGPYGYSVEWNAFPHAVLNRLQHIHRHAREPVYNWDSDELDANGLPPVLPDEIPDYGQAPDLYDNEPPDDDEAGYQEQYDKVKEAVAETATETAEPAGPVLGPMSLVDIAIEKARQQIDPAAHLQRQPISIQRLAMYFALAKHDLKFSKENTPTPPSNLGFQKTWPQKEWAAIINQISETTLIPTPLLYSIMHSFYCGECGLFSRSEFASHLRRDMHFDWQVMPSAGQKSGKDYEKNTKIVVMKRVCMRCKALKKGPGVVPPGGSDPALAPQNFVPVLAEDAILEMTQAELDTIIAAAVAAVTAGANALTIAEE